MAQDTSNILSRSVQPGRTSSPVTPHDSNIQPDNRGIFVGTGGTIVCILMDDTVARTYKNVPSGSHFPYSVKILLSTGTTAADMLAIN